MHACVTVSNQVEIYAAAWASPAATQNYIGRRLIFWSRQTMNFSSSNSMIVSVNFCVMQKESHYLFA